MQYHLLGACALNFLERGWGQSNDEGTPPCCTPDSAVPLQILLGPSKPFMAVLSPCAMPLGETTKGAT